MLYSTMRPVHLLAASIPLLVLLATPLAATTWHVPSHCPTIQTGIDSAAAGDTVLVACGTYHESDIDMKSGVVLRSETGLPDCVTIDGDDNTILVCDDLNAATRIEGLTLTNGFWGARCYWCLATFADCVFTGNHGPDGAGMILQDCQAVVIGCLFEGNTASGVGGALGCHGPWAASDRGARVVPPNTVTDCVFSGNSATYGGAIATTFESYLVITDCLFTENTALERGGALCLEGVSVTVSNCVLSGNAAQSGGAIFSNYAAPIITNCTLVGNTATDRGAGILVGVNSELVTLENTIIADSPDGEAIWCFGSPPVPVLRCCDLYGNADGDWAGCVAGQEGVNGNFSANPLFCDPSNNNFMLAANSPCLPANNSCGVLIGALEQGCGPVALMPESWARVKARYRQGGDP
jgi:predicted outer membrane repeat protein